MTSAKETTLMLHRLASASSVAASILAESDDLIKLIRSGAEYEICLAWVDENF